MIKKRWISLLIIVTMVFSLMNPAMLFAEGDKEETTVHRDEEKYEELIVSIEYHDDRGEIQLKSMENSVDLHEALLNKQGLDIKEASFDVKDLKKVTLSGVNPSGNVTERLKHSGYVYLVRNKEQETPLEVLREELKKELEASGLSLKYVEPNYSITIDGSSFEDVIETVSTLNPKQKPHYEMVHLEQAWEIATGTDTLRIAVLDSGIDHTHESLSDLVAPSLGKNFSVDGDADNTMDYNGHGTHVSGTIASYNQVDGMMKEATLIPVKVVGDDGNGTYYQAQQGIYHGVAMGATIINMSLGGDFYSQAFEDACNFAVDNGVAVVAAAGNQNKSQLNYPARFESVISVGATDLQGERAYFSNYGTGLDVMAPGVRIYSTVPGNQYAYKHGTSMAAPHVAGMIGLMRSEEPGLSVAEIRNILHETSAYSNGENQLEYGHGLINAYEGLQAVAGYEEAPELERIEIESLPNQTDYYVGQSFEDEGLIVKAHYSNGNERVIPSEDLNVEGFNSEDPAVDQTITIEYEGFEEAFTVTIHESGVPIAESVKSQAVSIGDALSASLLEGVFKDPYTGEVVQGDLQWKDESTVVLETKEYPWNFTPEKEWYETVEGSTEVKGIPTLMGIKIMTEPTKTDYPAEEELSLEGLEVQASYNNESTKMISHEELIIEGFDSSYPTEDQEITVSYEGYSDSFQVTISAIEPKLQDISAASVILGDHLKDAKLTGVFTDPRNGNEVEGTLAWQDGTLEITEAKETFQWIFTPESAMFSNVDGTLEVSGRLSEPAKRISGSNRYLTAYEIAKENNPNPDTVILVRGDSVNGVPQVVDGLTASGLAGALDAQILITRSHLLSSDIKDAITSLNPENIIIVGGTAAVSEEVVTALEEMDSLDLNIRRISGSNRYATAAEVALEIGEAKDNTAIIVNGRSNVDSLVAGPLAHKGYPILMVNNERGLIPEETKMAMKALGIEKVMIVGGTGVVSAELEAALNAMENVTVEARYGGINRIETSILLAGHEAFAGETQVSIVNGWSYVDAVAASTLGRPVVYFRERLGVTESIQELMKTKKGFIAIGGTAVIPEEIYQQFYELIEKH